jgi:hypothetical protein
MTLTMHDVMINIRVVRYGLGVLFWNSWMLAANVTGCYGKMWSLTIIKHFILESDVLQYILSNSELDVHQQQYPLSCSSLVWWSSGMILA